MNNFHIGFTGVRSGEYLIGVGKQTKGAIIQVKDGFFPPLQSYIEESIDNQIRDLLGWGFFENMTPDQRYRWIVDNSKNADLYLSEIQCKIRFISLGNSEFSKSIKLSEEDICVLSSGQWLDMLNVYKMFPGYQPQTVSTKGKTFGSCRRHTLIFRPSNWCLYNPDAHINYSVYINMLTGEFVSVVPAGMQCYKAEVKLNNTTLYFGVCDEAPYKSLDTFVDDDVKRVTHWFTPSLYKSLMQKCIRVRPEKVDMDGQHIPVEKVLISAFILLLKHPGAFVPNLNAFVNGAESAFKRLGISLLEDSTSSLNATTCLFAAALASREGYFPSLAFVQKCVDWALQGLSSSYYDYQTKSLKCDGMGPEEVWCCGMIDTLGSFESDINMVRYILKHKFKSMASAMPRPIVMPICHCLDQHSITEIVHYYTGPEKSAKNIVQHIWVRGTGINSRVKPFDVDANVYDAQRRLWIAKTARKMFIYAPRDAALFRGEMDIDPSWMAGLTGPMNHKFNRLDLISFYDPENIDKIITIRKPTRDGELMIDDNLKLDVALHITRERAETPLHIKSAILDFDCDVYYRNGDFRCVSRNNGSEFMWKDYCKSEFTMPIIENNSIVDREDDIDKLIEIAYNTSSNGVMENAFDLITAYIRRHSIAFLMRIGMYMRTIKSEIAIHKISKDGSGTYLMSDDNDSLVYRFFVYLCVVIPGVIETGPSLKFQIKYFPYWNLVRKHIFNMIQTTEQYQWSVVPHGNRELWENQRESVCTVLDRINEGKRGNMIWMDVGLGKTLIVLSVIETLIKENKMPKYCVFSITPSSEENICRQIGLMGLTVNKLDPRMKNMNISVKSNCVNIVMHDHMDDLHAVLKKVSSDTMFLFDEVHFMFANTKRTSVALELAKTCNMFIAMTGTLIKNKDIVKDHIIDWLSQVVDFELDSENYMIGVASLVSGKKELPIKQNRMQIEVPLLDENYYNYVDAKFGGKSAQVDYARAANICFDSIYHAMVNRVLHHKKENHGCVFVVAKDKTMQKRLHDELTAHGLRCFSVASGNSISITSTYNPERIEVVITTIRLDTGYDVTSARYMITAPYPSNEATRTQLIGRIVRISQLAPEVFIETLHCGILSYTLNHHETARMIAKSLSGMQKHM